MLSVAESARRCDATTFTYLLHNFQTTTGYPDWMGISLKMKTRKSINSIKTNFGLDALLLAAFLIATAPRLSGIPIHEWLSIAFGAAIVIHLLLHWQWIIATIRRFFSRMNSQQRINFVLNIFLFIDVTIIIFTGLVISRVALPALGIETIRGGIWRPLHSLSSDIAVFIVGLHVALHWQWIWSATKRYLVKPIAGRFGRAPAKVTSQEVRA